MERRTRVIFNVFFFYRWRGHVINIILRSWSVNIKGAVPVLYCDVPTSKSNLEDK